MQEKSPYKLLMIDITRNEIYFFANKRIKSEQNIKFNAWLDIGLHLDFVFEVLLDFELWRRHITLFIDGKEYS